MCADFYLQGAKTYSMMMVPAMRDYWPHTPLWASQSKVAGFCPTEVDVDPLVVNLKSLSIESIDARLFALKHTGGCELKRQYYSPQDSRQYMRVGYLICKGEARETHQSMACLDGRRQ